MFASNTEKKKTAVVAEKKDNMSRFFLSDNSVINGNVSTNEPAVINGTVEGTVSVENVLNLGPKSAVRGPVYAHTMTVEGGITGDVVCKGALYLTPTARITGNVQCVSMTVAEGAYFCGKLICNKPAENREATETVATETTESK